MKLFLVLAFMAATAVADQTRYDGYQVYTVKAKNQASFDALVSLYQESTNFDFWTEPRSIENSCDIMVPPSMKQTFLHLMRAFNIDYAVKIADVQSVIEKNRKDINTALPKQPRGSNRSPRYSLNWESFSDYPLILEFVNELAATYPNMVTLINIGKTATGQNDMIVVKISSGGNGKKAMFVDGGIHAREWISPAFVTWLIRELVENYAAHPQYVDQMDWYILPVMNPDGYRWTFADNGNRLWRKNRAPNSGSPCIGTDLNRNFGFHWNEGGSSALACSETYHGGSAFSQVESQNVRDFINSIANQTRVYLTFHTYGQYWLTPWGYTAELPTDYAELYGLAESACNKLTAVYGTQYTIGTSTNVLYIASGGSDDWAKGAAGIPFSYTVEMRDTGEYGFQVPADQIMPNNIEVWEGVKVVADSVIAAKSV